MGMCVAVYDRVIFVKLQDKSKRNFEGLVRARGVTIHTKFFTWSDEEDAYVAMIEVGGVGHYTIAVLVLVDQEEYYDVNVDCLVDPNATPSFQVVVYTGVDGDGDAIVGSSYRYIPPDTCECAKRIATSGAKTRFFKVCSKTRSEATSIKPLRSAPLAAFLALLLVGHLASLRSAPTKLTLD